MTTTIEQPVSVADYLELSRLVVEYTWRVDNGHADSVAELYTEDGEFILPNQTLRGRKAIADWGRQLVQAPPWRIIRHVCGNMRFTAAGPDAAEGTIVLTVFMVVGGAPATTIPFNVGEDHDRYVRTADGWKIVSRRWVELFSRGDVLNLPK